MKDQRHTELRPCSPKTKELQKRSSFFVSPQTKTTQTGTPVQGFRIKNTTRRVEIFQPEPVGLGLSWVVLDAYLCAWVNKKIPGAGLLFRK